LATSYALQCAVERTGDYDLVFCGRQAIDGDTAQVGPQVAEKLGVPQITYAESIQVLQDGEIVVQRAFPLGKETVKCTLPCLLTVVSSANRPRPPSVRRMIACKLAATALEYPTLLKQWPEFETAEALDRYLAEHDQQIPIWTAADIGADEEKLGLDGSPTKVWKVDYVVLETNESRQVPATPEGVSALVKELIQGHIL
jgi:electron transfer flavoprotein beta subunit